MTWLYPGGLFFIRSPVRLCLAALLLCTAALAEQKSTPPSLLLAARYTPTINLADYWVSEKLDGVRAYWDGERLISRNGNRFAAPDWFTERFPPTPLDGELWVGRQRFSETVSIVRRQRPHDGWRRVRFMLFDLPASTAIFDHRLVELQRLVARADSEFLAAVAQQRIHDHAALLQKLDALTAAGGKV